MASSGARGDTIRNILGRRTRQVKSVLHMDKTGQQRLPRTMDRRPQKNMRCSHEEKAATIWQRMAGKQKTKKSVLTKRMGRNMRGGKLQSKNMDVQRSRRLCRVQKPEESTHHGDPRSNGDKHIRQTNHHESDQDNRQRRIPNQENLP